MTNERIEKVEERVIELRKAIIALHNDLRAYGRSPSNYNHLGTLDINIKTLTKATSALSKYLDY